MCLLFNRSVAVSINLKQAFTFAWDDSDFFSKWVIGSFILVFPTLPEWFPGIKRMFANPANALFLAIFIILALIVYLAVTGYFYKTVHNRIVHAEEKLPDWKNFWEYVKNGIKAYCGSIIFALPYAAVFLAACYFLHPDFKSPVFLLILVILYMIFFALYLVMSLNFAIKLRFWAFFTYRRAFKRIKGRIKEYLIFYAYCLALSIGALIITAVFSLSGLTTLLIPFFAFYIYMVFADLYSQFLFE